MSINLDTLRHNLASQGWHHGPCHADDVLDTVAQLGSVIDKTEVALQADPGGTLFTANEMVTHTDHPAARYILWFCVQNDAAGGWSVLKDSFACYQRLDEAQQAYLRQVSIRVPGKGHDQRKPLVTLWADDTRPSFCYIPWGVVPSRNPRVWSAYCAFEDLVTKSDGVRLHLSPGEVLVVDNTWILHGRTAITPNARRRLTRYWIKTNGQHIGPNDAEA